MEKLLTHIAHDNDLYEIVFWSNGSIEQVVVTPDSNGRQSRPIYYWRLPTDVREKIRDRISEYLS